MKEYPDQKHSAGMDEMRDIIEEVLEESLPECRTNEWFITSVYFANMLDKMMEQIWGNI